MKKISFYCKKGGVGKTSLSVIIAHYIATKFRKKTLLIDADPQGNSSECLSSGEMVNKYELNDILNEKTDVLECISKYSDNFFFIKTACKGSDLRSDSDIIINKKRYFFSDLNEVLQKNGYEYVFYDLSPNLGILEKSILISIDEIISPFVPEKYGTSGLSSLVVDIGNLNVNERCKIKHDKVIINNKNSTLRSHEIVSELFAQMDFQIYTIPQDSKIKDSQLLRKPLFEIFPKAKSMNALKKLAEDIVGDNRSK